MKYLLKWPLIVTLAVIVVRIVLEELGAPQAVNTLLGVVWLQLLMPVYFGVVLANNKNLSPFVTLSKAVILYSLCTRLMVLMSYSMAYVFQWSAQRFSIEGGGVVGEGVAPLQGLLLTPAYNQVFWVIGGVVAGLLLGSTTLAIGLYFGRTRSEIPPEEPETSD
ncbi:MAG: hypothetical protein VYA53_09545 [Acidobacteriota bacterium]|nr:hypothetical protein [Acidobacteriota bacterium]